MPDNTEKMHCKFQHAPEEIMRIVVGCIDPSTSEPDGDILQLSPDEEPPQPLELLPMAHVCHAWRDAVQPHIWKHVRLSTVHGIHRLDLLTRLPWLTSLIKNVAVELKWDPAFHESGSGENWHTEIRGELEEYLFCDRQAVLNRSVDAGYAGQDEDDPAYFGDGKLMEFTQGPDGRGFDPFIKNADDAINSLESSILRLHSLERFVWQTAVLPMPLSLCQHLSRLDTLRLLRLEQQGEFRSAKRLPAPLWEIFGPGRQLDGLSLGLRVLPLYTNMSKENAFSDESHTLTQAIHHEFVDAEIPLHHSEHLFSTPIHTLPPMERPLAMATRLLEACVNNARARFVCLKDQTECLLRFRHLAHIWIKQPVTTENAMLSYGNRPHENRWLSAALAMRPALVALASTKKDRALDASDVALLPDGRDDLAPFADWLREDERVQRRVADAWNGVVQEGQDHSVPRAFSVQLVNDPDISEDDSWLYYTLHDYGPM